MTRPRYLPDDFTLALLATVALASFLPARGVAVGLLDGTTTFAIGLLFFLHGAKLSREAVRGGLFHWRLHLAILAFTFFVFPLLGLLLKPVLSPLVTPALYTGVLFLCVLPSTVQSAIAFTSIARGNVPAAICSASASTLLGVFVTPLLVGQFIVPQKLGPASFDAVERILLQLMLPFVVGHLCRPLVAGWIGRHGGIVGKVDRGSILLVVYTAFSAAVVEGLWRQVPLEALLGLAVVCAVLLALVLVMTTLFARWRRFDKADEIAMVFCGSKKSLASGVPMAKVLFAAPTLGAVLLPLMLFHQLQLMVCAVLAQRYGRRGEEGVGAKSTGAAHSPSHGHSR